MSVREIHGGINRSIIAGRDVIINLPWVWKLLAGALLLAGIVYFVATYGSALCHWYTHKAAGDEILILLADFRDESENVTYDAAGSIEEALRTALTKADLRDVRLVRIDQAFRRNELEAVRALGKRYNATIVIWGYYDDGGMFPRLTILQEDRLGMVPERPEDYLVNLANPPDDFTFYINRDLPSLLTYFTQFVIGQLFFLNESDAKALQVLEDAAQFAETIETEKIQSSLANIYIMKGMIYTNLRKDYQQAILDNDRAIDLEPNNAFAHNNRGYVYAKTGSLKQAILDYSRAIELDPDFVLAYNNRGNAYISSRDLEKAFLDFNKAIELAPDDAMAYYNRGNAHRISGNLEQAISDYTKAIKLSPDKAFIYSNRGAVYNWSGNLGQALMDLNKAIELDPGSAVAYNNRGLTYVDLGNAERAISDFSKAIELDPDFSDAYINRGLAFAYSDIPAQAIIDLERYLELVPDAFDREFVLNVIAQQKAKLQR